MKESVSLAHSFMKAHAAYLEVDARALTIGIYMFTFLLALFPKMGLVLVLLFSLL